MIVELGNHAAHPALGPRDGAPRVTTIHIPEADDQGLGGYTHEPGLAVADFQKHVADAMIGRNGITNLPEHEALLAVHAAWPTQSLERPAWVNVHPTELTPEGHVDDLHRFLSDHYECEVGRPADVDDRYWTRYGAPGVHEPRLPDVNALFTDDGRTQQAQNYGGGQVGATGVGSAAGATTLTSAATWTTNQWAGYRIVVFNTAGAGVWGNVISNTNSSNASVATVDRWYNFATPGGAAGTTPANGFYWAILDGGVASAWFVGLTTTNVSPAHGDHSLSGEYTTASGGYIRKIAPYALTSGVSPMSYTLVPVFTGNGSDTYPQTFYAIGVFTSMVTSDTTLTMKFETTLNATATVAASGDQVTVTETVTGS